MNPVRVLLVFLFVVGSLAFAGVPYPEYEGQSKREYLWNRFEEAHLKYGDIRESGEMPDLPVLEQGRFVGETVRIIITLVELSIAEPDTLQSPEVQAETRRFFGSLYSLKPLFEMIKEYNSDPETFAEFETGIIAEVFQISDDRLPRIQEIVLEYKLRSSGLEPSDSDWKSLNQAATEEVLTQLSEKERDMFAIGINLFRENGVLAPPLEDVSETE